MYENLLKAIHNKHLTKCKVAILSGISPSNFYSCLSGKNPFYPNYKKRICEVLEMNEEELFPSCEDVKGAM